MPSHSQQSKGHAVVERACGVASKPRAVSASCASWALVACPLAGECARSVAAAVAANGRAVGVTNPREPTAGLSSRKVK